MTPFFALALPVIVLFCGLALDVGLLELKSLQLQAAADSAAIGAAIEAERGTNNWLAQGQADAGANGFTNGSNNTTVTIAPKPGSGAYAGRYDALQATVTQQVSTIFMGALNGGTVTLTAQAAALVTPCVYLTGTGALQYYSIDIFTGSLNGQSCAIYVNTRLRVQSEGKMDAEAVNVTGSAASSTIAGYLYPNPAYNIPAMSDPLAAISSPAFSACNHTSYSLTNGTANLSPGTYCKGITLSGSTVTLNPGLYIITGGATWSNSTVTGSGVTLFFTQGGGGGYGKFTIQNGSNVNLSAPTDTSNGGIATILVFADRNWVHTATQDFVLDSSTIQGDGIWYLTNAGMYMWSCGIYTAPDYLGVVADNIYMGGTEFIPINNYSNVPTGNPFRTLPSLVQ